ncbi:ABC transporter permease [Corynebacterium cystitidis]|uniref:Transport permease protein n=2 Tax=Corynebacterium cystitidis TaxID=35757 RepID=A0A1H9WAT4_9CORY|nr:ABC transporter permease [Corynebacterium cystitidis]WJY82945.1 ABC-2 type transporter [Corynebacterium cystitidis DSM 20524]SES30899.1 teichoic acid transport system permease protein [Corynebacterium cystitidis DSM 20524]SNV68751.1 ABC transporter permease [Corynebacterium cystitidis]
MGRPGRHRLREENIKALNEAVVNHSGVVLIVEASELDPVTSRPRLPDYIKQSWDRRHFIWADARSKALKSTKNYRLWRFWLVVNPLLDVALYGFLFGFLLKTSRGVDNFVGFLVLGIIFMRMLTGLVGQGSGLIKASKGMITAFQFPRASLVLSQSIRACIDNLVPALVAIVLALLAQYHMPPSWTLMLVIPLYFLLHLFGAGLMFLAARATAVIPDLQALIRVGTQAWFFLSGVMYSVERFASDPIIYTAMSLNPAYQLLTAIRDATIYATVPTLSTWLVLCAWSFGTFAVGFIYFWRAEERYVRFA